MIHTTKKVRIIIISIVVIVTLITVWKVGKIISIKSTKEKEKECVELQTYLSEKAKEYFYGFDLDSFGVEQHKVKQGQSFSDILHHIGLNYQKVAAIESLPDKVFNSRFIKAGAVYHIIYRKDSVQTPAYMIYESGLTDYYIIKLEGKAEVKKMTRPVEIKRMEAKGAVESSLYNAFVKNNLSVNLAIAMSEIFAWTVDFYKVQKGDVFKVIYYEKYIEGKPAGIEYIEAAYFEHYGRPYYAFRFKEDGRYAYYDENGQSVRKMFLKAPVKFSRISSRYNLRRFHPVLKAVKPHLGTDYAAPAGTPVMSVGDGTVIETGYTSGNGNYIKIRHNSVYTTQYLHLSKFAKGIRKGKHVSQGEVIGYVGSTGLATGPHLCFRFWKNGRQVDPHKEKPMNTNPVKTENLPAFKTVVATLKPQLDKI
jgi:murein DD-endopeptidase MepM/ murein hydrolase activator NlpD